MAGEEWAPPGIDPTKPSVARVYDAFLGGKDNFAADRELVKMSLQVMPDAIQGALDNRAFLRRVVRYLTREAGIRHFIDIGSGLPSQGYVHEIAQEIDPRAKVVYVDNDPIVHLHAQALLGDTDTTAVITADLRRPDEIVGNAKVRELVDFSRPVGLLLFGILHHINDDEDPAGIAAKLRGAVPPGSYLAISHWLNPGSARPESAEWALTGERLFNEHFGTGRWRSREEILGYFGDFELLEPGMVPLPEWRPDVQGKLKEHRMYHILSGGVARKR